MKRTQTDILIAGGGVAGLTAAAAFATAGFSVICVDPVPPVTSAKDPAADLRSTAFLMPSVDLLQRAGLWQRLSMHAAPLRIMRIADAGGPEPVIREAASFDAGEIGGQCFGCNLPNWLLRREMVARLDDLDNARLLAPMRVEHLTPRSNAAITRLSDGSQISSSLVIAADGRDSSLRAAAGINARRWSYGQKALVFNVRHELPHNDTSTEVHRTGGPFTLVPLPDEDGSHCSAVVWMDFGPNAARLADMPVEEFEAALNIRSCGILGNLQLTSARRLWPIIAQVASRLDAPRTALIAESAHVIPPIGAQGLNMSLADITALLDLCSDARATGADIGASALLARYNRARHPDILARVAGVDALNRAAMTASQPLRDLRRTGLRALKSIRPLHQGAMRIGLGAGRPDSTL